MIPSSGRGELPRELRQAARVRPDSGQVQSKLGLLSAVQCEIGDVVVCQKRHSEIIVVVLTGPSYKRF